MTRKRVFAATLAASLLAFGAAAQAQGFGDGIANARDAFPNNPRRS